MTVVERIVSTVILGRWTIEVRDAVSCMELHAQGVGMGDSDLEGVDTAVLQQTEALRSPALAGASKIVEVVVGLQPGYLRGIEQAIAPPDLPQKRTARCLETGKGQQGQGNGSSAGA